LVSVKKEHIVIIISNLFHFKTMGNAKDESRFIFLVNKLIYILDYNVVFYTLNKYYYKVISLINTVVFILYITVLL